MAAAVLAAVAASGHAAEPVVEVTGSYTYYASPSDSRDAARRIALDGARAEALKNKFGTIVQQNVMQTDRIRNEREQTHFLALTSTESKGEWIADVADPEFDFDFDRKEGTLIVTCHVKGKARAISNEASIFNASVLRNGTTPRHADTSFRSGDQMYLSFLSPTSGYVTVFLADESGQVYQMLPYPYSHVEEVSVKRNTPYTFFAEDDGGDFGQVREMLLTAPDGEEFNQIYVLFSPNTYSLPPVSLNAGDIPPSMSQEDFSRWLLKVRRADSRMGVEKINIAISPDSGKTETINH